MHAGQAEGAKEAGRRPAGKRPISRAEQADDRPGGWILISSRMAVSQAGSSQPQAFGATIAHVRLNV